MTTTMRTRSAQRIDFLDGVLVTAIEHYGYGFPEIIEYPDVENTADAYALITDRYEDDDDQTYRVDLDVIARGIGVIKDAVAQDDPKFPDDGPVLFNAKTDQRLYLSHESRKAILEASRNNDAAELDVVDALAVLECALFGAVTYA